MSWLSEKMTEAQQYVWKRCADIDVALAGSSRWTRLSELPTDQFAAAMRILNWLDDEFHDGAAASVLRMQLATDGHAGNLVELSLGLLDAIGKPPPPVGRYWHGDLSVYVAHVDDFDADEAGL
ncbi:MAG TPA: hypothetical protein VIP27_10785 [Variovorax sp.]